MRSAEITWSDKDGNIEVEITPMTSDLHDPIGFFLMSKVERGRKPFDIKNL